MTNKWPKAQMNKHFSSIRAKNETPNDSQQSNTNHYTKTQNFASAYIIDLHVNRINCIQFITITTYMVWFGYWLVLVSSVCFACRRRYRKCCSPPLPWPPPPPPLPFHKTHLYSFAARHHTKREQRNSSAFKIR